MNAALDSSLTAIAPRPMRVTAVWGHRFGLDNADGDVRRAQARVRGKKLRPVCGDIVIAERLDGEADWLINAIEPRSNELARPDSRGRREVLAANVERIVVVACAKPAPDFFIVDRYLAAARLLPCAAMIVWNKCDLAAPPAAVADYRRIGYPVVTTSVTSGAGIDALAAEMQGLRNILVGQSGVGKSSLINALAADERQKTGSLSAASAEGRHTTVAAELLSLGNGIEVIDSPGVRDFAPAIESLADVTQGFVEIAAAAARCRFANCQHRAEPNCAVKQAVAEGAISERRYASYRRLAQLTRQLREGRY